MVHGAGERLLGVERQPVAVLAERAEAGHDRLSRRIDLLAQSSDEVVEGVPRGIRREVQRAGELRDEGVGHGSGVGGVRRGLEDDEVGGGQEHPLVVFVLCGAAGRVVDLERTEAGHGHGVAAHEALADGFAEGAEHVVGDGVGQHGQGGGHGREDTKRARRNR